MSTFKLVHDEARRRAMVAVRDAPEGMVVEIREPTRSLDANARLHAQLGDIAKTVTWAGRLRSIEVWKRLMVAAWLRARGESVEILPALDGHGVDVVFRRTSELSKREFAELIDFVDAWYVEHLTETEAA